MNSLEIYKLLPKKNCGECVSKTCMSFALFLKTNPEAIDQCRYVEPANLGKLQSTLVQSDWRDELIGSLRREISGLDLEEIAKDIGGNIRDKRIIIRCIGVDYAMEKDGTIVPDGGNKWITILLLNYIRNMGKGDFTGKWISFSEMKGGFVKAASFIRECEEPLRELMDGNSEGVVAALEGLKARPVAGYPADHAWSIDLLPRVRCLIIYRSADEEFPSSLNILFDGITGQFIDVESLVFLCEGLVHTLTTLLQK
jgi:hypothetical protein